MLILICEESTVTDLLLQSAQGARSMHQFDDKLAQMTMREESLQRELDSLVSQLFKHLRATCDSKGRFIASFAASAEPIASDIERLRASLRCSEPIIH